METKIKKKTGRKLSERKKTKGVVGQLKERQRKYEQIRLRRPTSKEKNNRIRNVFEKKGFKCVRVKNGMVIAAEAADGTKVLFEYGKNQHIVMKSKETGEIISQWKAA